MRKIFYFFSLKKSRFTELNFESTLIEDNLNKKLIIIIT